MIVIILLIAANNVAVLLVMDKHLFVVYVKKVIITKQVLFRQIFIYFY
jgi:hypothetical protein